MNEKIKDKMELPKDDALNLPSGWKIKKLGDVCELINGGTPKTNIPEYWNGHIHWMTPADLGKLSEPTVYDTSRKISNLGLDKSSAKLFPEYSVILSTRAPIGHLAINEVPMSTNQGCRGIVPSKKINVWYLYYYLKNNVELLNSLGTGTTFKELSTKALSSVQIPLPPLSEQQLIVSILDNALEAINKAKENAEQNLKNAKELFESYLHGVFERKAEGWENRRLGENDLIEIIDGDRGKNYPTKKDFADEGHCLFMNTKNVRPTGFEFNTTMFISQEKDKVMGKGKLKRNDVVMTTRGTIGNLGVYNDDVKHENIRINSGMLIFRPNQKQISSDYLFEVLRSGIIKEQIKKHVTGAAQPQLPIKTLVNFVFPVPKSIKVQQTIVRQLDALSAEIKKLESIYQQKLDDLGELKKSILQKAFSGKLKTAEEIILI